MAEWDRTTPWRQGKLLTDEAVNALNLRNNLPAEEGCILVISHDCDLAAEIAKEPTVEAIVGRFIDKPNGNLTHAKNARVLHLPFFTADKTQWVELVATKKLAISKSDLAGFTPRDDMGLDQRRHSILQQWLAARYRRAAFADSFENRLKMNGLDEKLSNILKPLGDHVRAIFFDVDDGQEVTRTDPMDTYTLRIYILHTTEPDPEKSLTVAEEARQKIETAFRKKLFDPDRSWRDIELCECTTISDEALTYAQSTLFKQWRLEHLSLREDSHQPMVQS
jgi:hypothetical protein